MGSGFTTLAETPVKVLGVVLHDRVQQLSPRLFQQAPDLMRFHASFNASHQPSSKLWYRGASMLRGNNAPRTGHATTGARRRYHAERTGREDPRTPVKHFIAREREVILKSYLLKTRSSVPDLRPLGT